MRYKTDSTSEENKIRFRNLALGDVFRLGSTLYVKTDEIEIRDEYEDNDQYFNAIDLNNGEHKYINGADTVEYYNGEIIFREDDFKSTWN